MASPVMIMRLKRRRQRQAGRNETALMLGLQFLVGILSAVAIAAVLTAAVCALVFLGVYSYFAKDLPAPEQIEELTLTSFETTKIYDRTGQHLLFEVIDPEGGDRTMIAFKDIPVHMRNATVALEDKTFYTNPAGINVEGLFRAIWYNLQIADTGQRPHGGSSITVQLIRNVAMDPEERFSVSYERKIKEAILSYELTRRYPGPEGRDRILEWYLNTVYYGNYAYGVEAAAKVYFGKHARDLTLPEAAMLAAIPQYPALNPIDNPDRAKARQALALDAMVREGYITAAEGEQAKKAELPRPPSAAQRKIDAPHFSLYVSNVLAQRYGKKALYGGGLHVITSLDYDLQKEAEAIVRKHVSGWDPSFKARNAAAVVIRPSTGEILAMVGSADFDDKTIDGQVNMATSPRQPGSSFKPFTYAAAFEQGYGPATLMYDVRTGFPRPGALPFVPENFDMVFHGPMSLRTALACSYNIPAVWMLDRIGLDAALEMAHRLGITDLRDRSSYGLSLTLGGGAVTLLDNTYAYSVFANAGVMAGTPVPPERREPGFRELDPVCILKVTDGRGRVLDEFHGPTVKEVLSPQVAYLMTNILSDDVARQPSYGPNSPLKLSRPAAAKTGTTNNYTDAWTVGYTPQIATGVWMGNSDYTQMNAMWGGRGAAPIWHDIMEYAHKDLPKVDFVEPPGMRWITVDALSGLLPGPYTQRTTKELFIEGRTPTAKDTLHQPFAICKASGKLATSYCPSDQIEQKVFAVFPPEVNDWVRNTKYPQPPDTYCDQHGPNLRSSDASITSPRIYQSVKGVVQITGNARIPGFHEYLVEYGQGLQPTEWIPIGGTHHNSVDNQVLENWDASQLSGLYTLRLTVRGSEDRQVTIPVTVDNTKPKAAIIHPSDKALYIKETDEYINIQVEATDNMAMDRVEFFVDEQKVGESRVAPYSLAYTLVMTDAKRSIIPPTPAMEPGEFTTAENDRPVKWKKTVEKGRTTYIHELGVGQTVSRTVIIQDSQAITLTLPSGWGAIWTTGGYTETHKIHAVAFDAAGNEFKSDPVVVYVAHKKPDKDRSGEPVPTPVPGRERATGWLLPEVWRERRDLYTGRVWG